METLQILNFKPEAYVPELVRLLECSLYTGNIRIRAPDPKVTQFSARLIPASDLKSTVVSQQSTPSSSSIIPAEAKVEDEESDDEGSEDEGSDDEVSDDEMSEGESDDDDDEAEVDDSLFEEHDASTEASQTMVDFDQGADSDLARSLYP